MVRHCGHFVYFWITEDFGPTIQDNMCDGQIECKHAEEHVFRADDLIELSPETNLHISR